VKGSADLCQIAAGILHIPWTALFEWKHEFQYIHCFISIMGLKIQFSGMTLCSWASSS